MKWYRSVDVDNFRQQYKGLDSSKQMLQTKIVHDQLPTGKDGAGDHRWKQRSSSNAHAAILRSTKHGNIWWRAKWIHTTALVSQNPFVLIRNFGRSPATQDGTWRTTALEATWINGWLPTTSCKNTQNTYVRYSTWPAIRQQSTIGFGIMHLMPKRVLTHQ